MRDTSKLPKWAQERIKNLEANQNKTEQGVVIQDVSIEQNAFKQDENFSVSVVAIADALGKNAEALKTLAQSIKPEHIDADFGSPISLSDVRHG